MSSAGRIVDLAATSRLPRCTARETYVEAGGLMSYGPSLPDPPARRHLCGQDPQGRQARRLARGAAHEFELVINLKTAQALGITIPPRCSSWPMR